MTSSAKKCGIGGGGNLGQSVGHQIVRASCRRGGGCKVLLRLEAVFTASSKSGAGFETQSSRLPAPRRGGEGKGRENSLNEVGEKASIKLHEEPVSMEGKREEKEKNAGNRGIPERVNFREIGYTHRGTSRGERKGGGRGGATLQKTPTTYMKKRKKEDTTSKGSRTRDKEGKTYRERLRNIQFINAVEFEEPLEWDKWKRGKKASGPKTLQMRKGCSKANTGRKRRNGKKRSPHILQNDVRGGAEDEPSKKACSPKRKSEHLKSGEKGKRKVAGNMPTKFRLLVGGKGGLQTAKRSSGQYLGDEGLHANLLKKMGGVSKEGGREHGTFATNLDSAGNPCRMKKRIAVAERREWT